MFYNRTMKILYVGNFSDIGSADFPRVRGFLKNQYKVICFNYRYKKMVLTNNLNNNKDVINKESSNSLKSLIYSQFGIFLIKLRNQYVRFDIFLKKKNYISFFDKINQLITFYLFGNWRINRQLINEIKKTKYDLVFLAKIDLINYRLIKKLNIYSKTWYFFMDPLDIANQMKAYRYASLATWSSATFTSVNRLFKRYGANTYFITEGYDSDMFFPNKNQEKKEIEVIFTGSVSPKRIKFIDFLKKNNINIVCYGIGWKDGPIFVEELASKYRSSKIILNFTKGNIGFSDRVLLSMGTGTLLLSEYCKDLELFFIKGNHLEWFKNESELLDLVRYYLENSQKREQIALNGQRFVLDNFSWKKITERIIRITNNLNLSS